MLVRVVDEEHVDVVHAEPVEALLDRAHHGVVGKVEHRIQRRRALPRLSGFGRRAFAQQPADLRRQDELIARLVPQHRAETLLGESEAIQGSGVEVADTALPCRFDDPVRLLVGDCLEEPAERSGAEAEPGQLQ